MRAALPGVLVLSLAGGCGGLADEFQANTEYGRFEVSVVRVEHATAEEVTELKHYEKLRVMRPLLAATLPQGSVVHVDAAASEYGPYRFGSGWLTRGDWHLGTHTVRTRMLEATSSDAAVVGAAVVAAPADPQHRVARLTARGPGTARVTFRAARLDDRSAPTAAVIEDSIVITVTSRAAN